MCKFCSSKNKKEINILNYDNHDHMNISYGQYQGVSVYSSLNMKGNMFILGASGSYRSKSDCYYEEWGLDCDNELAKEGNRSYIKIKYCPFCGKEIISTDYEINKANDDIKELEEKINTLKRKLNKYNIFFNITFDDIGTKYDNKGNLLYNAFYNDVDYKHTDYDNNNGLTLQELSKYYQNIKCQVMFLNKMSSNYFYRYHEEYSYPTYNIDDKIKCNCFSFGRFNSSNYIISEETYYQLQKLGFVKVNKTQVKEINDKRKEIETKIESLNSKIKELEDYIKTL